MLNTSVRGLDVDARGRCFTNFAGSANLEAIVNTLDDYSYLKSSS